MQFGKHLTRKRMEPVGSGATWTGSPKGVLSERKHHKPRLSLQNNTAGVREREDENRIREAGNRDEVEGVMANTLNAFRYGASLLANGAAGTRATQMGKSRGRSEWEHMSQKFLEFEVKRLLLIWRLIF